MRAIGRVEVELPCGMAIDGAIETGHTEARLSTLAVIRGIKLLLRERYQQHAQAVELDQGEPVFEQAVEITDRDDLAT